MTAPLTRAFYDRDPVIVARELLGKILVRKTEAGICTGRIVETEAYLSQGDTACHAHRGQTRKNASMFGPPGHLYVYPIHSRYCMNVVTEPAGVPSAVLLRAVEPLSGIELMRERRQREALRDLTRGPGRLCEAFAITRVQDGCDLTRRGEIWIGNENQPLTDTEVIVLSPRIGVTSAHELELRFFLAGNLYVSGKRALREG